MAGKAKITYGETKYVNLKKERAKRRQETLDKGNGPRDPDFRMGDPHYKEPVPVTRKEKQRKILEDGFNEYLRQNRRKK